MENQKPGEGRVLCSLELRLQPHQVRYGLG